MKLCRASIRLAADAAWPAWVPTQALFSQRNLCASERSWEHLVPCVWLLLGSLAFLQQQQQKICLDGKHLLLYAKALSRNLEGFHLGSKPEAISL